MKSSMDDVIIVNSLMLEDTVRRAVHGACDSIILTANAIKFQGTHELQSEILICEQGQRLEARFVHHYWKRVFEFLRLIPEQPLSIKITEDGRIIFKHVKF